MNLIYFDNKKYHNNKLCDVSVSYNVNNIQHATSGQSKKNTDDTIEVTYKKENPFDAKVGDKNLEILVFLLSLSCY